MVGWLLREVMVKFNKLSGYGVVGQDRQCGRSLGLALKYISEALSHPGREVPIIDHYPNRQADRCLFGMVAGLVDKMNLNYISMNKNLMSIRFDLYEDRESPETVLCEGRIVKRFDIPDNLIYIDEVAYKPM